MPGLQVKTASSTVEESESVALEDHEDEDTDEEDDEQ